MNSLLNQVKLTCVRSLTRHLIAALDEARIHIDAVGNRMQDATMPRLNDDAPAIANRFSTRLSHYFDNLDTNQTNQLELSDAQELDRSEHDYLEAALAMDSMIEYLRGRPSRANTQFINNLRQLLPAIEIDFTNNPLDPDQIGDSFNEAIRPLGYKSQYLLIMYREFNKGVFGSFDEVLKEANRLFSEAGSDTEQVTEIANNANLTQPVNASAAAEQAIGRSVSAEDQNVQAIAALLTQVDPDITEHPATIRQMQTLIRTHRIPSHQWSQNSYQQLQNALRAVPLPAGPGANQHDRQQQIADFNTQLSEQLQNQELILPCHVSSLIAATLLLYHTLAGDELLLPQSGNLILSSLPAVLQTLLDEQHNGGAATGQFFDHELHPLRQLLDLTDAITSSCMKTELSADAELYETLRTIMARATASTTIRPQDIALAIDRLVELEARQTGRNRRLARAISTAIPGSAASDQAQQFVAEVIEERVMKRVLDPAIRDVLDSYLRNVLLAIVSSEGIRGKSWHPVLKTIDVLLWTVQSSKFPGDEKCFARINARLLDNLNKALEIGGASHSKIVRFLRQLKQIQQYSFHAAELELQHSIPFHLQLLNSRRDPTSLTGLNAAMQRLEDTPNGSWFEYHSFNQGPLRCKLATRIESIGKFLFVDGTNRKLIEFTRPRLAADLQSGVMRVLATDSLTGRTLSHLQQQLASR